LRFLGIEENLHCYRFELENVDQILRIIDEKLTQKQKDVIKLRLKGFTQFYIGTLLNRHQTTVHKILNGNVDYKNSKKSNVKKRYGGIIKKLKKLCLDCNGLGGSGLSACKDCNGQGIKVINRMIGPGMIQRLQSQCTTCNGSKKIAEKICKSCNGNKTKTEEKPFLLNIEPGTYDGETKIFEDMGDELPNEKTTDKGVDTTNEGAETKTK
jgi:hypothetical protein